MNGVAKRPVIAEPYALEQRWARLVRDIIEPPLENVVGCGGWSRSDR